MGGKAYIYILAPNISYLINNNSVICMYSNSQHNQTGQETWLLVGGFNLYFASG